MKLIKNNIQIKKPHIYEIDLIRAITVFTVVAVHSLSFTNFLIKNTVANQWYNLLIHALHYNREMFMFVTGLVLTYVYYHRKFSTKNFWLKRALLVIIPYILWSAIYTVLNNPGHSFLDYSGLTLSNVLTGNASFQLYYILLSIQFYLIFPLFLSLLKKAAQHPWSILAVSLVLQVIFIFYDYHYLQIQYNSLPVWLQDFVLYQDRIVFVYQFFFILGGFAGLYIDQCRAFLTRHAKAIVALFLGSIVLFSSYYFYQLYFIHEPIQLATVVLQPSVDFYSFFVILFFAWLTTRWVKKMYAYKIIHVISESSFGIYFVHVLALSLIVQYLLPLTPNFIPVSIRVIAVLLLSFTSSTVFCYGLLKTPLLSWTIGRAQSVGQPIKSMKLWIINTGWYKKIAIIIFAIIAAILFTKVSTYIFLSAQAQSPNQIQYSSSDSVSQYTKIPLFHFKNDAIKNSSFVINRPVQSTGCSSTTPVNPGTISVSMISGTEQRIYLIYVPIRYANSVPHALILNFHGYAGSARLQERISHFNQLANKKGFIVVYPQGTPDENGMLGWNTGLHPSIRINDILFVSNLLNQVQSHLCVNPNRIYATGFSNGGGFVNELACTMYNRIAAFAPVSGSYVSSFKGCATNHPVSLIEFHGTADRIVPYNGNRRYREFSVSSWASNWALHDKCQLHPHISYDANKAIIYSWSGCENQSVITHYELLGIRHTWPKFRFPLTDNNHIQYIDTADLIWNFFVQHPLYKSVKTTSA